MFATGFLVLAACLLAQVIVGDDVWNRSAWRRYFFPGFGFVLGLAMWRRRQGTCRRNVGPRARQQEVVLVR